MESHIVGKVRGILDVDLFSLKNGFVKSLMVWINFLRVILCWSECGFHYFCDEIRKVNKGYVIIVVDWLMKWGIVFFILVKVVDWFHSYITIRVLDAIKGAGGRRVSIETHSSNGSCVDFIEEVAGKSGVKKDNLSPIMGSSMLFLHVSLNVVVDTIVHGE